MDLGSQQQRIDQWLDAALRQYGEAELRPGLESRVLANLRSQPAPRRGWLPLPAAVLLLLAIVFIFSPKRRHEAQSPHSVTISTHPAIENQSASGNSPPVGRSAIARKPRPVQVKQAAVPAAARGPKLDRFPSPRPLTEQEQILIRYVRERPEQARLLAQAQAQLMEKDRLEFEAMQPSAEGH
jgi:hypothetical protein